MHANRTAEQFWGVSRSEAMGKTLGELWPDANTETIDRLDVEAIASGEGTTQEAHPSFTSPTGERIVTSTRHAVRDTDGKPLYLVTVVEDVTARVRLEQDRDRDRLFLNQIVENVPTTIVVKDVRTRRYVLINQAAVNHFGIPRERIIGKTAHEIFAKESADIIEQHDAELLRTGSMYAPDYPIETPGAASASSRSASTSSATARTSRDISSASSRTSPTASCPRRALRIWPTTMR